MFCFFCKTKIDSENTGEIYRHINERKFVCASCGKTIFPELTLTRKGFETTIEKMHTDLGHKKNARICESCAVTILERGGKIE